MIGTCISIFCYASYRVLKLSIIALNLYYKYDPKTDIDAIMFSRGYEPYFPIVTSLQKIFNFNNNVTECDSLLKFLNYPKTTEYLSQFAFLNTLGVNDLIEFNMSTWVDSNHNVIPMYEEGDIVAEKYSSDLAHSYIEQKNYQDYINTVVFQNHPILIEAYYKKALAQKLFEDSINEYLHNINNSGGCVHESSYFNIKDHIYSSIKVKNTQSKHNIYNFKTFYDLKRLVHDELKFKSFYENKFSYENGIWRYNTYINLHSEKFMYLRLIRRFFPNWKKLDIDNIFKENLKSKKYRYYGKDKYYGKKW